MKGTLGALCSHFYGTWGKVAKYSDIWEAGPAGLELKNRFVRGQCTLYTGQAGLGQSEHICHAGKSSVCQGQVSVGFYPVQSNIMQPNVVKLCAVK